MSDVGRKPKLNTETLLEAIKKYATTETGVLAKKLKVNRTTLWRHMNKIPQEQIDNALREVAELELKPSETEYNVFIQIPEVADYKEKLEAKKRSETYKNRVLHGLFRTCVYLKKHPAKLTVEECAELLKEVQLDEQRRLNGKEPKTSFESVGELKKALRSWFLRKGISAQFLTSKGIEADKPKHDRERAHTRLTPQQRQKFMETLENKLRAMGVPEDELIQWIILPKYLYYTGTRIVATLVSRIEKLERPKGPLWVHNVKDKRALKWRKRVAGELKDLVARMLEIRGNPTEGLFFSLFNTYSNPKTRAEKIGRFFKQVYKEAGIPKRIWDGMPCHIWRHTACQDMLDATNYNFDLTAELLGWESVDTMKRHYGAIGEQTKDKALLEAMGYTVEWEEKEFKF